MKEEGKTYKVYFLVHNRQPENIRYVGITRMNPNKRLNGHKFDLDNSKKSNWIKSVKSSGGKVIMWIHKENLSLDEALSEEVRLIATLKELGYSLTNGTNGGDKGPPEGSRRADVASTLRKLWQDDDYRENTLNKTRAARLRLPPQSKSGFKGVRTEPLGNHIATASIDSKRIYLGTYATAEEAAIARDIEMLKHHKPDEVYLNFPHLVEDYRDMEPPKQITLKDRPTQATRAKTGYRGVTPKRGRFRATIFIRGKQTSLGSFETPLDAAKAYDKAAIEAFGRERAILNFPDECHS